jgi:hypothetical protein
MNTRNATAVTARNLPGILSLFEAGSIALHSEIPSTAKDRIAEKSICPQVAGSEFFPGKSYSFGAVSDVSSDFPLSLPRKSTAVTE